MRDQDLLFAIAESLANTAAGAPHDHLGSSNHRLYRLPVGARAVCFERAEDILDRLTAAGYQVEKVSSGA